MANALANLFTDIADSIRSKTGSTEKLSPSEFAAQIDSISVGGGGAEGCATVTFMNGDNVLLTRPVYIGDDCPDPVTQGRIETPTKESTVQYNYTYKGWASYNGGTANSSVLKNITEDKVVYSAYAQSTRYYTVTFYDGTTVLHTEQVAYGSSSTYTYEKEGQMFTGWVPSPTNIKGNLDCYGGWEELVVEVAEIADSWEDIVASVNDGSYSSKYKIGNYKPLDLGSEGIVNMQIVGMSADTLADGSGKAKTTWLSKEVLKTTRYVNDTMTATKYAFVDGASWTASGDTWTSQNGYSVSDAKAKWVITAISSGTLSIGYKTSNADTTKNKLSLVVDGVAVVTDYANTTNTTYTVEVTNGDVVTVEVTYSKLNTSFTKATITFGSTGTFTTEADIDEAPIRVKDGYEEGTGVVGGWEASKLRVYYKDTLKPLIPDIVRNSIKNVTKTSLILTAKGERVEATSIDDAWAPSCREMGIPDSTFSDESPWEQNGAVYTLLFTDNASRIKTLVSTTTPKEWWLRSVANFNVYGQSYIGTDGKQSYNDVASYRTKNCVLGFCI